MNLTQSIRTAVEEGRFLVGYHARKRLKRRKIRLWQIESGLDEGRIIAVRPKSKPNPSIVVAQVLVDGTIVKAVWSWLSMSQRAKLVTVFYPRGT